MAVVNGTAGNDVIHVAGDGVIVPPGYTDMPQATASDDVVSGLGGTDLLVGGGGSDLLDGGDGSDILVGGAGADTLLGGAGIDTIRYDGSQAVSINLVNARGANGDVISGVENVEGTGFDDSVYGSAASNTIGGADGGDYLLGGGGGDSLRGDAGGDYLGGEDGNDVLTGGDGDDALEGGAGADRLDGGLGTDDIEYRYSPSAVTVDLGRGLGSGGHTQGDVVSGIEDVAGSRNHGDTLIGSAVSNLLHGNGGNDILSGLGGNDGLYGGGDNDILRGGAGADILNGDVGIDLVSYYGATAALRIDLSGGVGSGGDAAGDTYTAIENVNGGLAGDQIYGTAAANTLNGFEGNDRLFGYDGDDALLGGIGDDALQGSAGADRLDGSAGIDTIYYYGTAGVAVDLSTGLCSGGQAQGDVISGIENIQGTTSFADNLVGSSVANRFDGIGGNDVLSGLGGSDTLIGDDGDDTLRGGDGDDFLHVGPGTDVMDGGAGRDTMVFTHAMVADWQSGALDADIGGDPWYNWEAIQGSSGDDRIRTNSWGFAVELRGGAGNDVLRGGAGADALVGAAGLDTASYYTGTTGVLVSLASGNASGGEAQGDTLSGIENLSGSQGSDSLYGNAGANVLQGWNGGDSLVGGAGKDTLTGGAGGDRYYFTALADSVVGANADVITDFSHAQGDRIDLAAIDARFTVANNQAFSFIGTAAFTGVAGQLHYWHDSGRTIVSGDVNGNRTADFNIVLTGTINLVAADFVL
ncbi:calcium-binding protein [Inquilinus sp. OTU3971]|uniref:calcium-binding protein n=1 Tax=Inquilinus sp. OTU3971 TaxID=3043855 RepID=UPI00313DF83D